LQCSPAQDRWIVKIAALRLVHGIAQNPSVPAPLEDIFVQFGGIRRRHDQKCSGQIGRPESPLLPNDSPQAGSFADARRGLWSDDTNFGAAADETQHLGLGHSPSADDQAWPPCEFQEYGK